MLEFPELIVISRQLEKIVCGKVIKSISQPAVAAQNTFFLGDEEYAANRLLNRTWSKTYVTGLYIESKFGGTTMLFGDGIQPFYLSDFAQAPTDPTQYSLLIEFEDNTGLVLTNHARGGIMIFAPGEYDCENYFYARNQRPPCRPEFNKKDFMNIVKVNEKKDLTLKEFMTRPQTAPGMEPGDVATEVFFRAQIDPHLKLNSLTPEEQGNFYEVLSETIFEMIAAGGRTTEKDLFGVSGTYEMQCGPDALRKDWIPMPRSNEKF